MDGLTYKMWSQNEIPEREHTDADPKEVTSEDIRYSRSWGDKYESRLQLLEKCNSALLGGIRQNELQEQECEKLRKKNRELEARYQKLLSKTMSMHKQSENMNDPMRLSAVLDMYKMLRIQEWGKCWSRSARFSYQRASIIIKKLFDACEKDIEMRKADIIEILCILPQNSCNQELMLDTVKLLRHGYYHNDSSIYSEIIRQADVSLKNTDQMEFAKKCCRVYCLLLLQDSPVKAVWNRDECSLQCLEHVDYKDLKYSKITELQMLWPVLKDGEEVIEKGVVWDEK
ncbi:uncharacterized protein LOC136052581 isoform X1 [Cyrtonyx montezumae]|uniref:uncharacterized protein LOC136052581 isoform X1 n=1 Tax=Cyrtonyx montezumae TaxID=9017 RepID=UPI0032DA7D63